MEARARVRETAVVVVQGIENEGLVQGRAAGKEKGKATALSREVVMYSFIFYQLLSLR